MAQQSILKIFKRRQKKNAKQKIKWGVWGVGGMRNERGSDRVWVESYYQHLDISEWCMTYSSSQPFKSQYQQENKKKKKQKKQITKMKLSETEREM